MEGNILNLKPGVVEVRVFFNNQKRKRRKKRVRPQEKRGTLKNPAHPMDRMAN
jgi:hypothetical protein